MSLRHLQTRLRWPHRKFRSRVDRWGRPPVVRAATRPSTHYYVEVYLLNDPHVTVGVARLAPLTRRSGFPRRKCLGRAGSHRKRRSGTGGGGGPMWTWTAARGQGGVLLWRL